MKKVWNYIPKEEITDEKTETNLENQSQSAMIKSLENMAKKTAEDQMRSEVMVDEGGRPRYQESWIGSIVHELFGNHHKL